MTLLESLAALVILGTTAVGFLEVFHTSARATRDAHEWTQTVTYAESLMEATKVEESPGDAADSTAPAPRGFVAQIESRAWAPGVTEVIVVVTSPTGRKFELRRLARERDAGGPGR